VNEAGSALEDEEKYSEALEWFRLGAVISYAPSATVLDALRRRDKQQESPRPFLGVGDVAYENQGGKGNRIPASETLRGRFVRGFADFVGMPLHDLPQTREEVENISKIVGKDAETLFGASATESAFKIIMTRKMKIARL